MTPKGNSPLILHILSRSSAIVLRVDIRKKREDAALSTLTNGRNEPDKRRRAKKASHKREACGCDA